MNRIILGTIAAVAAISLTACEKANTCKYNEATRALACAEKSYKTVNVGGKTWMAENLIRHDITGNSYCYGDVPANCDKYGSLYPFDVAAKICPDGWGLPSRADFEAADMNALNVQKSGYRYASNGKYADEGVSASFWTADSFDDARGTMVRVSDEGVAYEHFSKNIAFSVRCIKK